MPITFKVQTDQAAFDAVVRHLATMDDRCMDERGDNCVYERATDGQHCAIGALLNLKTEADHKWARNDSLPSINELAVEDQLDVGRLDVTLLGALQGTHDDAYYWTAGVGFHAWDRFRDIAVEYGLSQLVLKEVAG